MSLRISLAALFAVLAFGGCKSGPKRSSASIYEGNGPNFHYVEPEAAGRRVHSTTYH